MKIFLLFTFVYILSNKFKNCEMHYRGEGLLFSSWFLTSI